MRIGTQMGVEASITDKGQGKPVLLLHGWGGKADSWAPLIRDLSGACRVIAVDFPGQAGESQRPPVPWSVTEYMQWTLEVMDACHLSSCDIIAHSFGGRVALLLGAEHPERVDKLVITGGAGLPARKTLKRRLRARVYKILRALASSPLAGVLKDNGSALRKKLALRFGSADYNACDEEMKKTFVRVVNQDLSSTLPKIQAPTLLIWGDKDDATPLYMGKRMEAEISDAGLVVLENAGHYAYLERYPEFYRIVYQYLIG